MSTTKECGRFRAFHRVRTAGGCAPRVGAHSIFLFFENFVVSCNLSIVCYALICAHRVCTQWDGRANAAWDDPKGLRSIARPLCTTLWTILGQPPRCEVEELWAILTLRAWMYKLLAFALDITTRQVGSIAREGIIGNNYPCTDYSITRCHKPVSTSVTLFCYQGY